MVTGSLIGRRLPATATGRRQPAERGAHARHAAASLRSFATSSRSAYSSPVSTQSSNWITPSSVKRSRSQPSPASSRPSFLQFGHDLREQHRLEDRAVGRPLHHLDRFLHVDAHALPRLLLEEPVAHAHGGLERELLALADLGVRQLLVVLLQREHAERDVTGLVAHHVAQQLLEQRLGRHLVQEPERGEREALDHDLHAEVGHVPARVVR